MLLDLIEEIKRMCKDTEEGLMIISLDNKHLLQKVAVAEKKVSVRAEDCGTICSSIFKYSSDKTKRDESFEDNQGGFLVKHCNEKLKKGRKEAESAENNIINIRNGTMLVNEMQYDRSVREVVRETNAHESSVNAVPRIFKENWNAVDLKLRKVFMSRAAIGAMKCVIGHNYYRCQHSTINKNLIMLKCP